MAINFKKYNLTVVDETNIIELLKIDAIKPPNTSLNYYELIDEKFVFGRYMYEKNTLKPIGYWICREEIANNSIIVWNSVLKETDFCDIIIEFYRKRCADDGNTLTLLISEKDTALCIFLKKHNPKTKSVDSNVEFKFFTRYQDEFLNRELGCENPSNPH